MCIRDSPEINPSLGIEVTTGPLGQGFANGVGMAISEKILSSKFNLDSQIINHYIYAIVGDGDLQEGISSEAASLAGTLKLGKLIYIYDSNNITIDGSNDLAFTENVAQRFQAYGWDVTENIDGNDINAIESSITKAKNNQHYRLCNSLRAFKLSTPFLLVLHSYRTIWSTK